MAIKADPNYNYYPQGTIQQKYRPLNRFTLEVEFNDADNKNTIDNIADQRVLQLVQNSRNVYYLRFHGDGITNISNIEKGADRKPPLTIISSGRSAWIKQRYEDGKNLLQGEPHFKGIDDPTPLENGDMIPIYFPYRFSDDDYGKRGVYIFVDQNEYEIYANDLKETGMQVIGYQIGTATEPMMGFGACRYAVVKFLSNAGISKAWLMDDNVLFITNLSKNSITNTSGFNIFEQAMSKKPSLWALGGKGASACKSTFEIQKAVQNLAPPSKSLTYRPCQYDFLQQAVLLNIDQLTTTNDQQASFNFSPYFISSGEDVSLSYFLGKERCQAIWGCEIWKGNPQIKGEKNPAQEAVNTLLINNKNAIWEMLWAVNSIPVTSAKKDTDLRTLITLLYQNLERKAKNGNEKKTVTYIKAIEQILLKWLENERASLKTNNLAQKLLNSLFNFTSTKYVELEGEKIQYDIEVMNTSIQ